MFFQLPKPYPDELLYSVIARYLVHYGITRRAYAVSQLFGRRGYFPMDLPPCLEHVSKVTWNTWEMSSEQILEQLTLFPFYAAYIPSSRSAQCATDLKEGGHLGVRARLGLSSSLVKAKPFLQYCKDCATTDLLNYGETFWRRTHQLPGVQVCKTHGTLLINSKVSKAAYHFIDATSSYKSETIVEPGIFLDETAQKLAIVIATMCDEQLNRKGSDFSNGSIYHDYLEKLSELGFVKDGRIRSSYNIEMEIQKFYTAPLLKVLGVDVQLEKKSSWVRRMFTKNCESLHPLLHILTKLFLQEARSQSEKTSIPMSGSGPWKCPNKYANHQEDHRIEQVRKNSSSTGLIVYATCSCGIKFSFTKVLMLDTSMPADYRVSRFGTSYQLAAKRLSAEGMTVADIADKLRTAQRTVTTTLLPPDNDAHTKKSESEKKQKIEKWRELYRAYHELSAGEKNGLLRRQYRTIYVLLRKYDYEWLTQAMQARISDGRPLGVDWSARDEEWNSVIRATIDQLRKEAPFRRLSRHRILNRCNLLRLVQNIHRLPKVASTLDEFTESPGEFRLQRLYLLAQKLKEEGRPITRGALIRRFNVSKEHPVNAELENDISKVLADYELPLAFPK